MPIIEIKALPPAEEIDVASALAHVTTEVAAYLGEEPPGTWAIWRPVAPGAYAEGADAPAAQPRATHPAIVDVFAGRRDDPGGAAPRGQPDRRRGLRPRRRQRRGPPHGGGPFPRVLGRSSPYTPSVS